MDYESWFSVTHEKIAIHVTKRAENETYPTVIDSPESRKKYNIIKKQIHYICSLSFS